MFSTWRGLDDDDDDDDEAGGGALWLLLPDRRDLAGTVVQPPESAMVNGGVWFEKKKRENKGSVREANVYVRFSGHVWISHHLRLGKDLPGSTFFYIIFDIYRHCVVHL